ncbi:MAG: hypothetical protein V7641_5456 [Blastocatellia bacterium]
MFISIPPRPHAPSPFLHRARRCLLLPAFLLLAGPLTAQNNQAIPALEPDKPIERELAGGQAHDYRIKLDAGQYLSVVVDQRGIDVVVTLFDPDGKKLAEVDSPNGTLGPEPVAVIVETSGLYRLEVRSLESNVPAGRYEIKLVTLRPATPQDHSRLKGENLLLEAGQLVKQSDAGALRKAIEKYQTATLIWQTLADRQQEARTRFRMGQVQRLLGELLPANESFKQALALLEQRRISAARRRR